MSGIDNPIKNKRGSNLGDTVKSVRKYHVSTCVIKVNDP